MTTTVMCRPLAVLVAFHLAVSVVPANSGSSTLRGSTGISSYPAQDSGPAGETRRGKNDSRSREAKKGTQVNPARPEDSRLSRSPVVSRESRSDLAPESTAQDALDSSAQSDKRKEPPPFDRPPLSGEGAKARPRQQPSSDRAPQGSAERARTQPPPSETRPQADTDIDQPRRSTTTRVEERVERPKERPTLQRPSGSTSRDDAERVERAGGTGPQPVEEGEPIKLDATLVNVSLLISDRSGRFIPRLSERDILIFEDGAKQEIAFFSNEEVPFNVALLLDVSPSVHNSQQEIQNAALEFVRQLRQQDRVMVVSFDRRVNFLTGFTNDRRLLESAIRSVSIGSGTSVYDAVFETVVRRLNQVEGRKALILFSDGEDTTSRQAGYEEAIESVMESDVLVYGLRYPSSSGSVTRSPRNRYPDIQIPIPWPWPRRRGGNLMPGITTPRSVVQSRGRRGRDFMNDVTTAGGGPVYDAQHISDLRGLASRIAQELRYVYIVGYYPTNPLFNGGYRTIRVRVAGRDDLAVRHRRGYNARQMGTRAGS